MTRLSVPLLVLLAVSIAPTVSLRCRACYGPNCFNQAQWASVECPQEARACYAFQNTKSDPTPWKMGCTESSCLDAPGYQSGLACKSCSSNYCNGVFSHGVLPNTAETPSPTKPSTTRNPNDDLMGGGGGSGDMSGGGVSGARTTKAPPGNGAQPSGPKGAWGLVTLAALVFGVRLMTQ